jgi:hypothetical protein
VGGGRFISVGDALNRWKSKTEVKQLAVFSKMGDLKINVNAK